jgi:hypothetical protein
MNFPTRKCLFFIVLVLAHLCPVFVLAQPPVNRAPEAHITVCGLEIPPFVLKNKYAFRLIFPVADRASTQIGLLPGGKIRIGNILHEHRLWSATVDPKDFVSADVINQPILPGVFHFGAAFFFGDKGLTLEGPGGSKTMVSELVMGTGPEKAFSVDGTVGFQLLQMRSSSMEAFEGGKPLDPKVRNRLDPSRVNISLFFLAEVEEAARLAALTSIQALRVEHPEKTDNPMVQKYHFLGANCVSSGIQNLTRAVHPHLHHIILNKGKKDISAIMEWDPEIARKQIDSWIRITLLVVDALRGRELNERKFAEVADFHRNLRTSNQMSLPWRAKSIIDWAAGKSR